MIKNKYSAYNASLIESVKKHFMMMGRQVEDKDVTMLLDALVRNNPNFPGNEDVEEVINAFISAIHYGSLDLRNATIFAHTRAFSEWVKYRVVSTVSEAPTRSMKPENWSYDKEEPLPSDITKEKAKELLNTIAKLYQGDMDRVFKSENFMCYVNKLKNRYYE
jgi:hypothetical protein